MVTVTVKEAKWQAPIGCTKPETMPSLHVKCVRCAATPLEDKRHMFCKHDFSLLQPMVVPPLKSVHFMQACLSVRL